MGEAAVRLAQGSGLHECGHSGISGGRRAQFLFSGSEYAPAGGASGHGNGHGSRSCEAADPRRRGRAASLFAGGRQAFGPRRRVPPLRGRSRNQFFPSPGTILSRRAPSGPGIRLDDGVYEGFTVSTEYDPMLGKLIAWGQDRAEAIARLRRALEEHSVTGIKTNSAPSSRHSSRSGISARQKSILAGSTRGCRISCAEKQTQERDAAAEDAAILAALLHHLSAQKDAAPANGTARRKRSRAGNAKRGSSRSTEASSRAGET